MRGARPRVFKGFWVSSQDERDWIIGSRFRELIDQEPTVAGHGIRRVSSTTPFEFNWKKNLWCFRVERRTGRANRRRHHFSIYDEVQFLAICVPTRPLPALGRYRPSAERLRKRLDDNFGSSRL